MPFCSTFTTLDCRTSAVFLLLYLINIGGKNHQPLASANFEENLEGGITELSRPGFSKT